MCVPTTDGPKHFAAVIGVMIYVSSFLFMFLQPLCIWNSTPFDYLDYNIIIIVGLMVISTPAWTNNMVYDKWTFFQHSIYN